MYDYLKLKEAALNRKQLGIWKNLPVYAINQNDLGARGRRGIAYIVYDDRNSLVVDFKKVGSVSVDGTVKEMEAMDYLIEPNFKEVSRAIRETLKEEKKEIDKYLWEVNNLTIEKMLEGVRGRD